MGRIVAYISDETEEKLREKITRRGDLSKYVGNAIDLWLKEGDEDVEEKG